MTLRHLLLVYLVALVFGFNFIAAATALQQFPPFAFTVVRFFIVLVVVLPFIRLPQKGQWPRLFAVAVLNGAFHFSLFFLALRLSEDVSSVAILLQIYVPMSALFAVMMLGERIGWRTLSAIILAFAGVMVVSLEPSVFRHLEAVNFWKGSRVRIAVGFRGFGGFLIPDIRDPLQEEQRQDIPLPVSTIDRRAA